MSERGPVSDQVLSVRLPLPPRVLSPNGRPGHWATTHTARAGYRDDVCTALWERYGVGRLPRWERAELALVYTFPQHRRRDFDNLLGWALKPIQDAIVVTGILPDDDAGRLTAGRVRIIIDRAAEAGIEAVLTRQA